MMRFLPNTNEDSANPTKIVCEDNGSSTNGCKPKSGQTCGPSSFCAFGTTCDTDGNCKNNVDVNCTLSLSNAGYECEQHLQGLSWHHMYRYRCGDCTEQATLQV